MDTLKMVWKQLWPTILMAIVLALLVREVWACDPVYEYCGDVSWWEWLTSLFWGFMPGAIDGG